MTGTWGFKELRVAGMRMVLRKEKGKEKRQRKEQRRRKLMGRRKGGQRKKKEMATTVVEEKKEGVLAEKSERKRRGKVSEVKEKGIGCVTVPGQRNKITVRHKLVVD